MAKLRRFREETYRVPYLGIDIGTSAVKAVLVDEAQLVLAAAAVPLEVSRPRELWSEQDPALWWSATEVAVGHLRADVPEAFAAIRGIGLSGQMHGAVLLGPNQEPLRPAILWNDGRSFEEARDLAERQPDLARIVGVLPMPGFTAPKLLWLARHEPETFRATRTVLLPKDYVRLQLTGELATDMSDAAGTWWLDQAVRTWSDDALAASGMDRSRMPRLMEGPEPSGFLRRRIAANWGLRPGIVVAAGAGDAAAGAVGLGAIDDGAAFLSLGTSGQFFVTTADFRPAPATLVHAFSHAVPERWFQMAALLNGASCLAWIAGIFREDPGRLLEECEVTFEGPSELLFLPYLSGERSPHNDPHARGVFFGLTPASSRRDLVQAVLEGVAFSFLDAKDSLAAAGTIVTSAGVIGGGARSQFWIRILASALEIPLTRYRGGEKGPAFGAARLARLAVTGENPDAVCTPPERLDVIVPDHHLGEAYRSRITRFRRHYRALREDFAEAGRAA
jgi:xylulokinase